ncbi:MAG: hypothetical protein K2X66_03980 [Cyanobacteria bacterium]|nr:hypothetical protein [Cyanobacteriota bacterium]
MNPKTSQSFETDKDPTSTDAHTQHEEMGRVPISPISNDPIYVYLHTHWDREWYQPFRQYQVRLAEVVDTLLGQIDAEVFPSFMLDGQTVLVDDYLELRPYQKNRLLSHIQSGQLNVGPWYVMPDELLVCGESLIRNLKQGMESAMTWGCSEFTGYLPDTFGHSGDLPYIFQQCGIQTAVVWRGVTLADSLFVWKSPQGAQVLTSFLPKGYFQNVIQDAQLSEIERYQLLLEQIC